MKAVILLSGGLDSSTVLYQAKADGCQCYAISFDYQQRHRKELNSALMLANTVGVIEHQVVNFDLRQWGGSALTDDKINYLNSDRWLKWLIISLSPMFLPGIRSF